MFTVEGKDMYSFLLNFCSLYMLYAVNVSSISLFRFEQNNRHLCSVLFAGTLSYIFMAYFFRVCMCE